MNVTEFGEKFQRASGEVSRALIGQEDVIEHVLIAIFARGHVLIEGVPGLGKTLLVRALSHVVGAGFKRIQFTPDLMPTDVSGGNVFDAKEGAFRFLPGPVFTQLLLADEINRAPAKTQSSLLEAMQDRSVTADGVTRPLPDPFFVIATQNPVESQGTYPLPEAQLDRFLLKLEVRHPSKQAEKKVLEYYLHGFDPAALERIGLERVLTAEEVVSMQAALADVRVDSGIMDYIIDIVGRTRAHPSVYLGASPRASIGLLVTARARAASESRDFVTPDDVKMLAPAVLRHRLVLHPDAELEGVTADDLRRLDSQGRSGSKDFRMIPARPLVLLLLVPLALALVALVDRSMLLVMLGVDAGILAVALADLALALPRRVTATRDAPDVFSLGRPNRVRLTLRSSARRLLRVRAMDDLWQDARSVGLPIEQAVPRRGSVEVDYHVEPARRGDYALGDTWLRHPSLLGLWTRQVRISHEHPVRVYPDLQQIRTYELLARQNREYSLVRATRQKGGESEFERLREYTHDDEYRSVDWKATARRQKLIARQYQMESNQNVVFVLEAGRLMRAEVDGLSYYDHALNATLLLAHVAGRAGDRVGLVSFDEGVRAFVQPTGGSRAGERLIRASYGLHPRLVESDWDAAFAQIGLRLRKRSLVVIFTQVVDDVAAAAIVKRTRGLLPRHLPLLVLFEDTGNGDVAGAASQGGARSLRERRCCRAHPLARAHRPRSRTSRSVGARDIPHRAHGKARDAVSGGEGEAPVVIRKSSIPCALALVGCATGPVPPAPAPPPAPKPSAASTSPAPTPPPAPAAARVEPGEPLVPFPPADVTPPEEGSAQPEDGKWTPLAQAEHGDRAAESKPVLVRTVVHPHRVSKWMSVTIVAVDLQRARLHLLAGTDEPKSADAPPELRTGLIPSEDRDQLLAVFNGGWQTAHGHWGMMVSGHTFVAPKTEGCTIALMKDGAVRVRSFPKLESQVGEMTAFRQTPPCLLEEAALHPALVANQERAWGGQSPKLKTRQRTAIGVDESGKILYYAYSEEAGAKKLAEGLLAAHVASAAELDINFHWTRFLLFGTQSKDGLLGVTSTLAPKMVHEKGAYVDRPHARDFFYVTRR